MSTEIQMSRTEQEDSIKLYFEEINRTPLLTFEEEKALSKRIMAGDKSALHHLIKANLLLVVKIAKSYVSKDYQLMDIIQDGNLGLIKAAEKYDYRRAVRFSTYASWWIKQSIVRSLSLKKRMIRLPHRKEEKLRQVNRAFNSLNQSLGRSPKLEEIALTLDIPIDEVKDLMSLTSQVLYYESPVFNEDCALYNILEDNSYSPDQLFLDETLKQDTQMALSSLIAKERKVLFHRFGFEKNKKYTLKKMGNQLGISAETVRQIEVKALKKIRDRYTYLKDYLQ